jgi:hypothetical protein
VTVNSRPAMHDSQWGILNHILERSPDSRTLLLGRKLRGHYESRVGIVHSGLRVAMRAIGLFEYAGENYAREARLYPVPNCDVFPQDVALIVDPFTCSQTKVT